MAETNEEGDGKLNNYVEYMLIFLENAVVRNGYYDEPEYPLELLYL